MATASARPRTTAALVAALTGALLLAPPLLGAAPPAVAATAGISSVSVPDTAYAVPSGAVFLSPSGSDTGTGAVGSPYRTLAKALSAVPSGGTVVARGGTYRDGVSTSTYKAFTLQAYPHEQVWFDGADVVTGWTSSGAADWTHAWSTPAFCAGHYYDAAYRSQSSANTGPCTHQDMAADPTNPAAGDPQMVFVDGVPLPEVTSLAQVAGGFFYDQSARVLHLGVNPSGHTVELAARASALVLQGGTGGATVRGVGFRRYATNEFNGNTTHGAVLAGEPHLTFESDAFAFQAGAGLSFSDPRQGVVRSSTFVRNGFNGLDANGHQRSGGTDDFSLLNSTLDANNTELFGTACSASCAAAGSKITHMTGLTVKGNTFSGTNGNAKGLWCDLATSSATIVDNVMRGNGDTGLYYEVSDSALIASNLMTGNRGYGLKVGAANTRIVNNTLAGNGSTALLVYDDDRSPGVSGWSDVGPDTAKVTLLNNVVSGGMVGLWRTSATSPNTGPGTFLTGMDDDSYYRAAAGTLVDWRDGATTSYSGVAALRTARGLEAHGQDVVGGGDPFFTNAAGGDYRIRSTSAAHASGAPLPADVAAAIGVSAGVAVDRGALVYPGR